MSKEVLLELASETSKQVHDLKIRPDTHMV